MDNMDNNFSTPEQTSAPSATVEREPLPQFDGQMQAPAFEQASAGNGTHPEVEACVNAAFGKSLAATIMAFFPICSIIAIVFGCKGLRLVNEAIEKANRLGVQPSGKNVAAKVLGMIGKIAGIVYTVLYGIEFLYIFVLIAALL